MADRITIEAESLTLKDSTGAVIYQTEAPVEPPIEPPIEPIEPPVEPPYEPPTGGPGRVVLPTIQQAQAPTDVVGFNLENKQGSTLASRYITFQLTFRSGKVTPSTNLAVLVGGGKIPVQMDVKTKHADGSVRSALVTFQHPSIPAGGSLSCMLSTTGTASTAPPLSLANYNDDLKVTIGGTVLDAAALARQATSMWQEGPLCVQGRADVPISGSLHATLDMTLYADGTMTTDVAANNDYAMQDEGGTESYTAKIVQKGATLLQQNVTHYQYQCWHFVVGGSPVNVVQDINYLISTGAIPNFDLKAGAAEDDIKTATSNPILGSGAVEKSMGTTGGRPDIGLIPGWHAVWLLTQDSRAAKYALVQADVGGTVPWHLFDPKTGSYLSLDDYPTMWIDSRGDPTLTQPPGNTGWELDCAHAPNLSYVPYLLTGRRYYLDGLNAQATFSIFAVWPDPRQNGKGLVVNGTDQVRQQGWSLRVIDEAAWINPDGSVEQANFKKVSASNWDWMNAQTSKWTTQQGEPHGWIPGEYRDGMAPWQQDYFALMVLQAVLMGNAKAKTFLGWMSNWLVERFHKESNGFPPKRGAAYALSATAKTWSQLGSGLSNAWDDGNYAEWAAQSLAGIITTTGSARAQQALDWMKDNGAPYMPNEQPYFDEPQIGVVPRQ